MGIFSKVIQRLHRQPAQNGLPSPEQDKLIRQVERYTPLIMLQETRRPIEVILPSHIDSFHSMIIGLDLYQSKLIIDGISPAIKHPHILEGHSIELRHYQGQKALIIQSTVDRYDEENDCYEIDLPESLAYRPRRMHKRYPFVDKMTGKCTVYPVYGSPWYGTLNNISLGGMRITVAGDLRNVLRKHLLLKRCEINVGHHDIRCSARVKSFNYVSRPFRHTIVSIAFEASDSIEDDLADIIDDVMAIH